MAGAVESAIGNLIKALAVRVGGQGEPHRYAADRAQRMGRTISALVGAIPAEHRPGRADLAQLAAAYTCVVMAPGGAAAQEDPAELAADQLKGQIPPTDIDLVLRILSEYRKQSTTLPEAQLLSDAMTLEDVGMVGMWNSTRSFHAAGKTLDQLLRLWKTQLEYGYWETRLREGVHFDVTRVTAKRRLDALHAIFDRMGREQAGTDVGQER